MRVFYFFVYAGRAIGKLTIALETFAPIPSAVDGEYLSLGPTRILTVTLR
jgi:hypothetical protein